MDTSGFDTVARHIPLYRERLLALPGWVKDQAFDIHIASGQPLSLSGKEGALFLGKKGVTRAFQEGIVTTPQQLRELFLAACGHSVFRHEEELRQGYVRLGENLRVGVCGTAVAEGGQVRSLRDITALVYRIPRQVPGCGDRLFLEGVPLERGVLVVGPPSSGKTTFLRDVARSLSLGRFGPSRRVAVVDERGELGGYDLGPNADVLRGYPQGRRAGCRHPHPLPGSGRPRRALPKGLGGCPGRGGGRGGAAGLCPRGGGASFPAPFVPGLAGNRGLWHGGVPFRAGRARGGGSLGARGPGRGCGLP